MCWELWERSKADPTDVGAPSVVWHNHIWSYKKKKRQQGGGDRERKYYRWEPVRKWRDGGRSFALTETNKLILMAYKRQQGTVCKNYDADHRMTHAQIKSSSWLSKTADETLSSVNVVTPTLSGNTWSLQPGSEAIPLDKETTFSNRNLPFHINWFKSPIIHSPEPHNIQSNYCPEQVS